MYLGKTTKVAVALLLGATNAFAGGGGNGKSLTDFNAFRDACQNPAKYQNQIAPSHIEITCTDVQYVWLPSESGSIDMTTRRFITSEMSSDKYSVSATTQELPSGHQASVCPRFKEATATVSIAKSLSCEDILGFPGTATDYCMALADNMKNGNAQSIQYQDTGRMQDSCGTSTSQSQNQDQQKQAPSKPSKFNR